MSRDEQNDEMRYLADEMGKAISTELEKRYLADERKLEEVLKANGWCKASDLAEKIFAEIDEIFERQIYESRWLDQNGKVLGVVDVFYAFECWRDYIKPELKKKYTEVAERRKGVENSPVDCSTPSVTESQREAKRREDIEKSPVDCSTPSVTDSKGERNEQIY